ncbi:hypothetical protein GOODEAATRI_016012, partial [Goodea atripinnis]
VGSFFMINLCLVVIATQFSETKQREHQLMQEQRARCSSSSTLASEPGDCYEELFQLVCHCLRKARRQTVAFFNTLRGKPRGFRGCAKELTDGVGPVCVAGDEAEEEAMENTNNEDKQKEGSKVKDKKKTKGAEDHIGCSPKKRCKELWQETRKKLWSIVESKYFNRGIMIAILINTISMGIEHHEQVIQTFI